MPSPRHIVIQHSVRDKGDVAALVALRSLLGALPHGPRFDALGVGGRALHPLTLPLSHQAKFYPHFSWRGSPRRSASILKLCVVALSFDFAAARLRSGRTGGDNSLSCSPRSAAARMKRSGSREENRSPLECLLPFQVHLPVAHATMAHPHDFAQALRSRAESLMTQKATNVLSRFISPNFEVHQAISKMEQGWTIKAVVTGEKGWLPKCVQ